jgi:hypothetical protein
MKFLAVIEVVPGAPIEAIRGDLPQELRGSWALYASGVLREAYATESPSRVVFILEASDAADAKRHLDALPFFARGAMQVHLVELRPFVNWSMLFAQ